MASHREDGPTHRGNEINRRDFVQRAAMTAAAFAVTPPSSLLPGSSKDDVLAQIPRQHDAMVQILRDWIALPSIAAENRGYPQGAEHMATLARDVGFQNVELIPTAGKPGVFATLDVGAKTTLASTSCTTSSSSIRRSGARRRWRDASSTSRASAR